MKTHLLTAIAATACLFLTSCDKEETLPPPAPAKKIQTTALMEPPVPAGPTEAELEQEIEALRAQKDELEARNLDLSGQIEDERLAAAEAEIEKERQLLQKEREAWLLEQQLADAKFATSPEPLPELDPSYVSAPNYDYQTFYDELAPLGSWYNTPDYGYVWQPGISITETSWRPYTRGKWACSDRGWTWCSDEPFGWACYHYGRWAQIRGRGWVWVPGDQWGPAWVAWRKTEKHIGWCPLPPETVYDRDITYGSTIDRDCGINPGWYVFVPAAHFDEPVLGHCEPPPVCLTICHTSINITNIVIRRRGVECGGPRYEWVRDCIQRPLPRYTIACEGIRPGRDRRPLVEKDRIQCYAPKVYAPWNVSLRPVRTKDTLKGVEVVRAEGGLPPKLVSRFKVEKRQREKANESLAGTSARGIVERQKRLADLQKSREELTERVSKEKDAGVVKTGEIPNASRGEIANRNGRNGRPLPGPARQTEGDGAAKPAEVPARADAGRENSRLAAAKTELARLRAQQEAKQPETASNPPPATTAPAHPPTAAVDNGEHARLAKTRADLNARTEELARLRAQREAAAKSRQRPADETVTNPATAKVDPATAREENARRRNQERQQNEEAAANQRALAEQRRQTSEKARNENTSREAETAKATRAAMEEQRRQQQDAAAEQTRRQQQSAAVEQKRQQAEEGSRNERASREAEQATARANMEEQRRRQQQDAATAEQARQQRAAAMEEQRKQLAEQARVERQAREQAAAQQREELARQRAAMEQQRQQAEEANRQEQMRRQAEQQAAMEQQQQQRRQAEEANRQEQMRRAAEDRAREQQERAAMEQQRRAEEQQRRAAEENQRRQADENNRRESERKSREASDRERTKGGR